MSIFIIFRFDIFVYCNVVIIAKMPFESSLKLIGQLKENNNNKRNISAGYYKSKSLLMEIKCGEHWFPATEKKYFFH